ncbi:MAG: DNA mismatch repair protein MutS [Bacteroidota bacterium]
MLKTQQEILTNYKSLITDLTAKIARIKIKIDNFSFIRVGLLIAEVFIIVWCVSASTNLMILAGSTALIIPVAIFIVVVKKQNVLAKNENFLKHLLWVYQNEVNLINGLENSYDNGASFEDGSHPYTADLDIFGESSLFALINRCSTENGRMHLAANLIAANSKTILLNRQAAVKEVMIDIVRTYSFRAGLRGHEVSKIAQIKNKLKTQLAHQLKFSRKGFLRTYVKLLPIFATVLLIAALLVGGKLWSIIALLTLLNASITFYFSKRINIVYYGFSGAASLLSDYAEAIKWTEGKNWKSSYIKGLFESEDKVSDQIKGLAKIIQAFDARLNILLSAILNFFLLWDLRCCIKIDEWHQAVSTKVENGLDRIGHFEELISLATLGYNYPEWIFPDLSDEFVLQTTAIGHPLIAEHKRVTNDFYLLPQPTVDIITGSNMAGKSTFLRTLGINLVLAYAGAPVCAKQAKVSIFEVLTYMRIKDSLNEQTSTFKAELNRLKMILTNVEKATLPQNSLVLIDEMLRGTNSRDKFLGSKVFIEKLIQLKTPALFATHDLQLSELEAIHQAAVRNYHFDIQITDGEMDFDYKLKDGACRTFNAATLLKEIGLSVE